MALLDSASSPRVVQNLVGDALPVLVLTTHSSLADEQLTALLSRATPVFVMMDLPVIWHVDHWIGQGATVRFAVSPLTGISSAELWLAAFMIDFTPGMVFLSINGAVAITRLSERIRNRPDGQAPIVDPAVLSDNRAGINLAVSHIFTLWSLLDQNGTLF